jgi:hypothetical protein
MKQMFCIPFLHSGHHHMDSKMPESPKSVWQYAGESLGRQKTSGSHYVFAKANGKQFSAVAQFEISLAPATF